MMMMSLSGGRQFAAAHLFLVMSSSSLGGRLPAGWRMDSSPQNQGNTPWPASKGQHFRVTLVGWDEVPPELTWVVEIACGRGDPSSQNQGNTPHGLLPDCCFLLGVFNYLGMLLPTASISWTRFPRGGSSVRSTMGGEAA